MRLGVDFDNTIVSYDTVFQRVARDRGLIPGTVPASKQAVRNYLRANGKEEDWIRLQGAVYGPAMGHAQPFDGVFETIGALKAAGVEVFVISHRTRHPFRGPQHDLHAAARQWLETAALASALDQDRIFFELTKEAKLDRIFRCGCTHFIDDLPEFLGLPDFPAGVERILFDPDGAHDAGGIVFPSYASWHAIRERLLP